ncbi:MAG: VOC family protein [Variovorax sp.]
MADSTDAPPSILSHVSLGTDDFPRAKAFYDAVLGTLGIRLLMEEANMAAYGRAFPEFWVQTPHDGGKAGVANGVHVAFLATSRAQVAAFHAEAVAQGAKDDGPPGPRPHYGEPYYGCFVRDPQGHKVEAMFWDGPPPDPV